MRSSSRPEADLHCHTTASDGQLAPRQLVQLAAELGLRTIGITDHDTIQGWQEAIQAGREFGVGILRGIELSTITGADPDATHVPSPKKENGEIHVLGYEFRWESPLTNKLADLRSARHRRMQMILTRLSSVGIDIAEAEVLKFARGESVGRPHIAQALIEHGLAADIEDAFKRYIGSGAPAYVPRYRLAPEQAIELIRASGGVAVLAHPGGRVQAEQITGWVKVGLQGIEVSHSDHTTEQEDYWRSLARQYGLLMTGGSDFHGEGHKPGVPLGGWGVSLAVAERIRELANQTNS